MTLGAPGYHDRSLLLTRPLTGYRNWTVNLHHLNQLCPVTFVSQTWTAGVNHATCQRRFRLTTCGKQGNYRSAFTGVFFDHGHEHGEDCWQDYPCDPPVKKGCGCGFWVTTDPDTIAGGGYRHDSEDFPLILSGVVEGGGRVVVGPKGFRASQARVLAVTVPRVLDELIVRRWVRVESPSRKFDGDPAELSTGEDAAAFRSELVGGLVGAYPGVAVYDDVDVMLGDFVLSDCRQILEAEENADA